MSPVVAPLDRLRAVTRGTASTENLESVLQSITDSLVQLGGSGNSGSRSLPDRARIDLLGR